MDSAVYCDAKWFDGMAAVGVVSACQTDTKVFATVSSSEAEREAIRFAKSLYPDQLIFNDSSGPCAIEGAIWIPREQNKKAHAAAAIAFRTRMTGATVEVVN